MSHLGGVHTSPPLAAILVRPTLPAPERLVEIGMGLAIVVVVAWLVRLVLFRLVMRFEQVMIAAGHHTPAAEQRARTLGQTLRSLVTTMVGASALIYGLEVVGWDIRPLLAGAGIIGVALGFGAQTLVRDVIAGIFILAENQYAVGDLIEINGRPATVESITVRSTRLRDFNGYVHYVPNGELKTITNRSRGWNRTPVDVTVHGGVKVDEVLRACRAVAAEMNADPRWRDRLLDPIDVWGVESLAGGQVLVRLVVRAEPGPNGPDASRELRRRLHATLATIDANVTSGIGPTQLAGPAPGPAFEPLTAAPAPSPAGPNEE